MWHKTFVPQPLKESHSVKTCVIANLTFYFIKMHLLTSTIILVSVTLVHFSVNIFAVSLLDTFEYMEVSNNDNIGTELSTV